MRAWLPLVLAACSPGSRSHGGVDPDATLAPDALACASTCNGNVAHTCTDDGSGYVDTVCDPVQGMSCSDGHCVGACATIGTSYIGCDYFPAVTGNAVGEAFDYAVAISNASGADATVTIDGGALAQPMMIDVPPGRVQVQILPWQQALKLCDTVQTDGCEQTGLPAGAFATGGAYHVRSTQPVTVYQFNALEYSTDGVTFSYSNDASLMIPTNAWQDEYYVAAYPSQGPYPSELEVVAHVDGTQVTVVTTANTLAGGGLPAFFQGVPQTLTLNAGDALELTAHTGDLTGTWVRSTAPVEVIGGHFCADVPLNVSACDHLEETMFPVATLGTHYVINPPAVPDLPTGKVEVIRIIATADDTAIAYDPPQIGAATTIAHAGDFIEIASNGASFAITASAKVLVAQYMEGEQAGGSYGDPAMALAVPVEQFRKDYLFHAPVTYQINYVDVTAPTGAQVSLDGVPLALTPIGTTGYAIARAQDISLGPNNDGNHTITADQGVGITVYGYGQYTSYWYPGGLDLTPILQSH